jgi:glucose-1-phosphate cytidylyltransferase
LNRVRIPVALRAHTRPIDVSKVVILADGLDLKTGTPRAMTELGGRPLLWHLMMHFAARGLRDFVIGLGDGGERVKRYLVDLCALSGNLTVHLGDGRVERTGGKQLDWRVDLVHASPGLEGLKPYAGNGTFILARGDALSDIDLSAVLRFHRGHSRLASIVAVRPEARFGLLDMVGDEVVDFAEKPRTGDDWTSAGLYFLEPDALAPSDESSDWEQELIEGLSAEGELMAYRHEAFWQTAETLRDRQALESAWQSGSAPWKNWE